MVPYYIYRGTDTLLDMLDEFLTSSLSPALAVHSAPGTVGVSFFPA